ncbi:hypothetical protein AFE_2100 [Acidithiobacillus ferrooxidans ATCC 23270]|uniref:Uncharacterized protein n=1 Tax=Acidithiobacillus ferrooxidans (strain ATCC 23270 / DSM 14882 / CIP 104768 / NCIMB 8455) TaxID=243159 RepID=B7J4W0_ACIF2|nr:hypothetical protein AFE_2100 [Acidithiobacillus ferrooxidans ATCC 23270]
MTMEMLGLFMLVPMNLKIAFYKSYGINILFLRWSEIHGRELFHYTIITDQLVMQDGLD